jgi:hypothetical protein
MKAAAAAWVMATPAEKQSGEVSEKLIFSPLFLSSRESWEEFEGADNCPAQDGLPLRDK